MVARREQRGAAAHGRPVSQLTGQPHASALKGLFMSLKTKPLV